MEREDIKMLVKNWWDIYNDESLDYKKCATVVDKEADLMNLKPFITALTHTEAGRVNYVTAPPAA